MIACKYQRTVSIKNDIIWQCVVTIHYYNITSDSGVEMLVSGLMYFI